MADQYTLATKPNMQQLQTSVLLDWQYTLDQLLDQSSLWEIEEPSGAGGPKELGLIVVNNIHALPNNC